MSLELIDVSNVNGSVDWRKVRAAGVNGVWLKATEGLTFDDLLFATQRRLANAAGLRVGAYHFARPNNNDAEAEANHFCRIIGKIGRRDLKPVLDLEQKTALHPAELVAWARRFNQQVLNRTGVLPAFYSYPDYIRALNADKPIGNGLWIASYGTNDGARHPVAVPLPWKRYVAHQYTSRGEVAGVRGVVDRSYAPRLNGVLAYPILGLL